MDAARLKQLETDLRRWKRISGFLTGALGLMVLAVSGLLAVLMIQGSQYRLAAGAAQRTAERQRDNAVQMWQASDAALREATRNRPVQDVR